MTQDKILDRIRKMHNLAEAEKQLGNLAAAENYAVMVQKMLDRHKLDMMDVPELQQKHDDPLGSSYVQWYKYGIPHKEKRIEWMENMSAAIAFGCHCQTLVSTKSSAVWIVGRESDRAVAEHLIVTLVRAATEQAEAGYWKARYKAQKSKGTYNTGAYKTSFLNGFSRAIIDRMYTARQTAEATEPGMGLMIRKSREEVQATVAELVGPKPKKVKAPKRRRTVSIDAYQAGLSSGREASLHRAIEAGDPQAKELT